MKTMLYITTIIVALNCAVFAYPPDPDNAALLYYQSFLLCGQPDESMQTILKEVIDGRANANEKVEEYVAKYKQAIRLAIVASSMPHCDWGLKYSDGLSMEMPYLGHTKVVAYLILCDARIHAGKGDFRMALEKCLAAQRMARHHGDSTDVGYLVGNSISLKSSNCIQDILSQMPADSEILNWLGEELKSIDAMPFSDKAIIEKGASAFRIYLNKEKIKDLLQFPGFKLDSIKDADEEFFRQSISYWDNYIAGIMSALALPYPQAYPELERLQKEYITDAAKNPHATLTRALAPVSEQIYNGSIVGRTNLNAIRTAIEIYKIIAQTGQLPDELAAGSPKDLFSDKAFGYEKTTEGFILRCQGKDLSKDETYEFKFKTK